MPSLEIVYNHGREIDLQMETPGKHRELSTSWGSANVDHLQLGPMFEMHKRLVLV